MTCRNIQEYDERLRLDSKTIANSEEYSYERMRRGIWAFSRMILALKVEGFDLEAGTM